MVPLPEMLPDKVPPAVLPVKDRLPLAKPVTTSVNTTSNTMGDVLVGSDWPLPWLIVTSGERLSKVTVLSVLVEAVLLLPAAS